jgi:hypothetical protein
MNNKLNTNFEDLILLSSSKFGFLSKLPISFLFILRSIFMRTNKITEQDKKDLKTIKEMKRGLDGD